MEIGRTFTSNNSSLVQQQRADLPNHQPKQENQERSKQDDTNVMNVKKEDLMDVKKKMDGVNQFLKSSNTNLKFNLHEELNEYYLTIIDEETKEVIKEVPPKKLLDIYAAMVEALGLFIDKKI